jgi:hypothetical protein
MVVDESDAQMTAHRRDPEAVGPIAHEAWEEAERARLFDESGCCICRHAEGARR